MSCFVELGIYAERPLWFQTRRWIGARIRLFKTRGQLAAVKRHVSDIERAEDW
jgi:hypothetical protein